MNFQAPQGEEVLPTAASHHTGYKRKKNLRLLTFPGFVTLDGKSQGNTKYDEVSMKQCVSQGPSRKQMSHSNWVTWRELIKELQKYNQGVEKPQGTVLYTDPY